MRAVRVRWQSVNLWSELGQCCLLLMETCWVVPWLRSLTPTLHRLSSPAAVTLLLAFALAALYLTRLIDRLALITPVRTTLLLVLLFAGIGLGLRLILFPGGVGILDLIRRSLASLSSAFELIPNELIVIFVVIFAWRRGVVAGTAGLQGPGVTGLKLRLGALAFALFGLIYRSDGLAPLLEVLPVYFCGGLMAVALSRMDHVGRVRGGARAPFATGWLAALAAGIVLLSALGVLAGWGLRTEPAHWLAGLLGTMLLRLIELTLLLLSPLVIGLALLLEQLSRLLPDLSLLYPLLQSLRDLLRGFQSLPSTTPAQPLGWLAPYATQLKTTVVVALVLVLALLAVRGAQRLSRAQRQRTDEEEARASVDANLLGELRRWGEQAWHGWARIAGIRQGRQLLAAAAIRRIYAQTLRLAEDLGQRRRSSETPREFLPTLQALFPGHAGEVDAITMAYERVRYGELPEDPEEVAHVRSCWGAVRSAAKAHQGSGLIG
jgi:hypothetical protein